MDPDSSTLPDFDPAALQSLPMIADGSAPELADRLFSLFGSTSEQHFDTMARGLRESDHTSLLRAVHTLKASAARVGAAALAAEAARVEQLLHEGHAFSPEWPAALRALFDRAQQAITKHRAAPLA